MSTRRLRRPKTGLDREKFDFPAAFGSVWERLGTCSERVRSTLKTLTGDLGGRDLSSARRLASDGHKNGSKALSVRLTSRCGDRVPHGFGRLWHDRGGVDYSCGAVCPELMAPALVASAAASGA